MSGIEVAAVRLSPPRFDEPDIERGERRAWTDLTITVRNRSPQTTYYVRADLGGLRYDAGTKTLSAVLSELPPVRNLRFAFLPQPNFLPVLPGTTATLEAAIPLELKGLDFSVPGVPELQVVDLSGVRRVEVTLTCDVTPFRAVTTDPTDRIREQLHAWGERIVHRCDCRIPAAAGREEGSRNASRSP